MADETVLLNLFDTLRHHWVMATIAIVGIFGGATVYAENLPNSYEASVVLAFAPRPEVGVSADTVRLVTPKYVAYLTSAQTITRAAGEADLEPERLDGAVEARAEVDSGNVIVSVELESADEAADVANALAAQAVGFSDDDDLVTGEIVAEALPPMTPSGPPRRMIEAAALLVGLLSALGLSLMVEATRPRLRTWADLRRATGFNV
ncbi:MAG TPA: hypothetical protein VJ820_04115, partial [Propionibacteriaceae bacterium]|nr:hypothetical protein [Propionibacteriaceae bacterium]